MHTSAKLALVLLAAAAPAAAQSSDAVNDLTAIYDPTPRITKVSTTVREEPRTSSRPSLDLSFRTSHPDTVPARPLEVFELSLYASLRDSGAVHFSGVEKATLLVDDSVEILLKGEYRARPWTESVAFPVSLSQALKLSRARSVRGRIGVWEFDLAPEEIARIGRLVAYARLDPGAPVPDRWTVSPGEFGGQGPL
jgi:hypothetical protein